VIQQRHRATAAIYLTSDLVATVAAFFAAWWLRFGSGLFAHDHLPDFGRYLILLPIIVFLWPLVIYFHGLYQASRGRNRMDEALTMVVAIVLATVLLASAIVLVRPTYIAAEGVKQVFSYSRGFLGLFAALDLLLVIAARATIRKRLRASRLRGQNLVRILVVGAGQLGRDVTRKILNHREFGFQVVGFLDDDPAKRDRTYFDIPVLGTLDDISRLTSERRIDQVILALPLDAHRRMLEVADIASQECVELRMVPDIFQYATLKATIEDLDGTPVINLSQVPLQGWSSLVKRTVDVALAAIGLAAVLPLFPFVALAIWLEDRGPIFYRQERMGLDGRPFDMLKLRSMRVDAESSTGPVWAVRDDPRRTRFGAFLRRWSLDELPQLWNVLRGDMSMIGPRPERPAFVREFKGKIPQYMLRHRVKAGITGWAQVHGWRGNTSIQKRLQYDLYYIENWSLKLDLKILWMTLRYGLRTNAY
jgi:exopolysaccharide biosynthesis polyprenyl glycosylphosphotransferase